ncbi:cell division initiation protein [Streptomyces sp. BR123]|uniref:cell division initiation protein n=1 Tax=Streptomyces sp. BR123 TaxID=2749828 RepID=UPI0015C43573|nr:cell division initiation protein [Streptomyces sp. BR123]NXY93642.1 cell division initiation protein [Streptomyces sp. BR123]
MDVQKKLDEIVAAVGGARSMPMSASCVINRAELLALLDEVRQALPGSLAQAQELIGGREQMVEEARQEADRIIESAHVQRGTLISDTEVARRSRDEADRILAEAHREAAEIRAQADDYVDSKLANFEVVLAKTIGSVDRGREKLMGHGAGLDEHGHPDADAPEPSTDPETRRRQADAYVDTKLATFEAVLTKTLEAVGRGRQKLLGQVPTDDLGAHIAAQDAAGVPQSRSASDADFLAGLAEPAQHLQAPAPLIPAQTAAEPAYNAYDAYGYGQQPAPQDGCPGAGSGSTGAAYAAPPYGDPYGYPQPPAQPDPYAAAYGGQPDPYAAYGHHGAGRPQQGALDETSFFDTSMINVEQLRGYEQGR